MDPTTNPTPVNEPSQPVVPPEPTPTVTPTPAPAPAPSQAAAPQTTAWQSPAPAVVSPTVGAAPQTSSFFTPVNPDAPAPAATTPTLSPVPVDPTAPSAVVGGSFDPAEPLTPQNTGVVSGGKGSKKGLKAALITLVALLIIGGGSAAAFFAVYVPNRPDKILQDALLNTLQQKQVNFDGSITASSASGAGPAYKVSLKGGGDATKKVADVQLTLDISGVTISVEARSIDGNIYLKVGDLTEIATLAGAASPQLGTLVKSLNGELANQWIEIDSTTLNSFGSCTALTNTSPTLTKADIDLLSKQYGKNAFIKIDSTTNDTVNGKSVKKMVLSINDDKAAAFSKGLDNLSIFKSLASCDKSASNSTSSITGDHDTTPVTVWVDKANKQIVQISSSSTAADAKKADIKASGTITFNYNAVSVDTPTGAKPFMQVLTQVETSLSSSGIDLGSLFGGSTSVDTSTLTD